MLRSAANGSVNQGSGNGSRGGRTAKGPDTSIESDRTQGHTIARAWYDSKTSGDGKKYHQQAAAPISTASALYSAWKGSVESEVQRQNLPSST